MRPQEKSRAQAHKQRFQNLPQRQKQIINQRFQKFNSLDTPEQQRLRSIQKRFQRLPARQRKKTKENFERRAEAANQSKINP